MASAYNKPKTLSPFSSTLNKMNTDSQNRSAVVTKLQKEIKCLDEENKSLKSELVELRDAVKQIFNENRHEKFDERRINMIKFQVIQLERQISILTEALGTRSEVLMEVENSMSMIADRLRSFIAADVKGPMVPIARSDLVALVESSESSRIKLFKSVEKNTSQAVGKDLLYMNPCLTNTMRQEKPVTLLDISLNRLEYINLRYVSQLESKLSLLYKELVRIHNQVETAQGKNGNCLLLDGHVTQSESEKLKTSLLKTGVMIKDCTDDLLALSLLCPSAPWPVLKRPVLKDIPVDRIIDALPPLSQNKQKEVSHIIKASLSTLNYRVNLLQKDKAVLQEELAFHCAVYDSQMEYTKIVFDAVREGCKEFEGSARKLLCAPLKSLLESYRHLQTSKSEDALRKILLNLKANEAQMTSIVEMFEDPGAENDIRSEALSSFSAEFMEHVNSLVTECQKKRDAAVLKKKEVKEYLKSSEVQLHQCVEELEAKYDKQWVPKQNRIDSKASAQSFSDLDHTAQNTSRSLSGKKDKLKAIQNSCSSSKEFIHSQLFGASDDKDFRTEGANSSREIVANSETIRNSLDNDSENVLKLRSFLDDEGDNENNNLKKSAQKPKWFNDFSSSQPDSSIERKEIDDVNVNSGTASSQQNSALVQKRTRKLWKPEKEWVNDFNSNSNLLDVTDDLRLSSREPTQLRGIDMVSYHDSSKDVETKQPFLPKSQQRGNRRSYEVDLRVAKQKLKLKRPGSISDLTADKDKKS